MNDEGCVHRQLNVTVPRMLQFYPPVIYPHTAYNSEDLVWVVVQEYSEALRELPRTTLRSRPFQPFLATANLQWVPCRTAIGNCKSRLLWKKPCGTCALHLREAYLHSCAARNHGLHNWSAQPAKMVDLMQMPSIRIER